MRAPTKVHHIGATCPGSLSPPPVPLELPGKEASPLSRGLLRDCQELR